MSDDVLVDDERPDPAEGDDDGDAVSLHAMVDTLTDDVGDGYDGDPGVIDLAADETAALQQADWHLRKLARVRAERARLDALFQAELDRLRARHDELARVLDGRAEWHERPLRDLHRALLDRDPSLKSVHLPHGDLLARRGQARWEWTDPAGFLEWCAAEGFDGLVRWHPTPHKTAAKAAFTVAVDESGQGRAVASTGQPVPGVVVHPAEVNFRIETV